MLPDMNPFPTRSGDVLAMFLFAEKFQVKFLISPGVSGVVQLCFGSGVECVLLQSINRFPYGDGMMPCGFEDP